MTKYLEECARRFNSVIAGWSPADQFSYVESDGEAISNHVGCIANLRSRVLVDTPDGSYDCISGFGYSNKVLRIYCDEHTLQLKAGTLHSYSWPTATNRSCVILVNRENFVAQPKRRIFRPSVILLHPKGSAYDFEGKDYALMEQVRAQAVTSHSLKDVVCRLFSTD